MSLPSPSYEYFESKIDLNEKCIKKPDSTFFIKASGDSMKDAGICEDDILIIDSSLMAFSKSIVLVSIDDEMMVRRILRKKNLIMLYPENEEFFPIRITPEMDFEILGVITYVVHKTK